MKRQKRIALINDITGFGRCSVTVELPLLSAMKIQVCPLPTAILSVHTGFPDHYLDDYTDRMRPYMDSWEKNQLSFDGICTGFLGSAQQIEIVAEFIRRFKQPSTRVMVDPVMGDYGRLYSSYTQEMCDDMRQLLPYADLVTPNLTEACQLLDIPYPAGGQVSDRDLEYMASALAACGPSQVIITGLSEGDHIRNFIYEAGRGTVLQVEKVGGDRSGSGDAFMAIVAGSLINGENLEQAAHKAAGFISKCLAYAVELDLPWNYGLPFEEYLRELK
ncbi:MAG: pyridoxamine kinase [Selenomonas sp.]|jgi:pyridoxine kinase|nr:pyridoxamine kinase [Selenomonas sp.]